MNDRETNCIIMTILLLSLYIFLLLIDYLSAAINDNCRDKRRTHAQETRLYAWKCSFDVSINNSVNIKLYIRLNYDYQCSRPTLQPLHIVQVVMSL
jgi:hypothetical protein